jgi:hypothetical protein
VIEQRREELLTVVLVLLLMASTVGYGDVFPVTVVGRIIAGASPFWGSGYLPCPPVSWGLASWKSCNTGGGARLEFAPTAAGKFMIEG